MELKDVLVRLGYVRNKANLSARELSFRIGMSSQYIAQVESGRIKLSVDKLLQILEVCNFSVERFFSSDIEHYEENNELKNLIEALPANKKENIIEFIKR